MRKRRRTMALLLTLGLFGGASQAASQGEAEREQRREQLQRSRALLAEAGQQFASAEYDSAEASLRSVLVGDEGNADAHYLLSRTLLVQGDTTAASGILRQGVDRAPFSTRLKLLLARLQIETGEAEEAGVALDGVLRIRPHDGEALYLRGLVHLALGDSLGALSAWRASLAVAVDGSGP